MRAVHLVGFCLFAALTAACGSDNPGRSICDNTVPAPAACMTQCDPNPSAPNTCPSGYHCAPDGFCDARCTPGGNECGDGYTCTNDGRCKGDGDCVGIECNITDCQKQGKPETTLKGTVYAPNGTLPLYGITVYVPNEPVGPLPDGAQCARCNDTLPGAPLVQATTDENGNFTLTGVPKGTDVPLVITSGKWRRQIKIPMVAECAETTVAAANSRLPKDKSEGDIPKIALTTGNADSLECLIRKLGIADSEITNASGTGRVHFYRGNGVDQFNGAFAGGANAMLTSAGTLWNDVNNLKPYDIVILSCEGSQQNQDSMKDQDDLNAIKAYADLGGRVFASHWHNIWIGGGFSANQSNPTPVITTWRPIAEWQDTNNPPDPTIDLIDETNNPKGTAFANWMFGPGVMGSTTRGEISVTSGRITAVGLDNTKAERWTYLKASPNQPQNFQFTTPQEEPDLGKRCGKVVFSDMHVSGGPIGGNDYPDSCRNPTIFTPQEKALAFMLFDLASCIGVLL